MFFFLEENEIDAARFPQFQILLFNLTYLTYNHVQRGRGGSSIFGLNTMWFLGSFYLEFSHFTRHFTCYVHLCQSCYQFYMILIKNILEKLKYRGTPMLK